MKLYLNISFWSVLFSFLLSSCNDGLDIQQDFNFTVSHLPVQTKIKQGETTEIRCQIEREGEYQNTKYFIRYFQSEGKGELQLENGTVLLPNDLYKLTKDEFRLYYTSRSTDRQLINVYFLDSFGNTSSLSFDFNNVKE